MNQMEMYTLKHESLKVTVSYHINRLMTYSQVHVLKLVKRNKIHLILLFGKLRKKEKSMGKPMGERKTGLAY